MSAPERAHRDMAFYEAIPFRAAWKLGTARQDRKPVFISGPPRSGTTWVLETLERALTARRYWEPIKALQAAHPPISAYHGGLRPLMPHPAQHPQLVPFLADIMNNGVPLSLGQARNTELGQAANLARIASAPVTILKFTAAQRLVPWLGRTFDNRGFVLLRNPLALVASLKAMEPRGADWSANIVPLYLPDELRARFAEIPLMQKREVPKIEEVMVRACLDTVMPLSDEQGAATCTFVTYESLYADSALFDALIERLGCSDIQAAPVDTGRPSGTTRAESNVVSGGDATQSWRHRLTGEEIARTLETMQAFGIDFYSADGECDEERLQARYGIDLVPR
ncbi:MAG: hypothetical protein WBA68_13035 [Alteraurantiacibacter sp.]